MDRPIDFDDDRHHIAGTRVTAAPWFLLLLLRSRPNRLVTRDFMLSALPGDPGPGALDVYVHRLRRALAALSPRYSIETVRGAGFIFTATCP